MKKFLLAAVTLAAVAAWSLPASALTLEESLYNAKLYDRSNIYSDSTPEGFGESVDAGDEQRNLFTIDLLEWQGTKADIGGPGDINAGPAYPGWPGSGSLTGLLYDVNFRRIEGGASYTGGSETLYFEKGTRYVAGTDWIDTYQPDGFDAATVAGAGGLLFVYLDTASPILATDLDGISSASLTEKTVATTDAAIPGGLTDGAPGVTDQEPWLILTLMPNPQIAGGDSLPTDLIAEAFAVNPTTGQFLGFGTAFANVIGGTALLDSPFGVNTFGLGLDVKFNFSVSNPGVDSDWQANSSDPVMFAVTQVPEPATLGLMIGLGLAGFGLYRRRN